MTGFQRTVSTLCRLTSIDAMLAPTLTAYDPPGTGEGSRDPLGLESLAGRLADTYLPAVTSRMQRIRALTVISVGAHVCQPFLDEYTADDSAPAWLAFEWMWVEAIARSGAEAQGIPGIETARRRLRGKERLCTANYLKGATSLGLHGVYRTLATDTRVIDFDGALDENGELLVRAWEADQGLSGFLDDKSLGGRVLHFLRRGVEASLRKSASAAPPTGEASWRLVDHLAPAMSRGSRRERVGLRALLDEDEDRKATLMVLESPSVAQSEGEAALLATAHADAARRPDPPFPDIAASLGALITYERLSGALTVAFDLMRYRSTQLERRPVPLDKLAHGDHARVVAELPGLLADCEQACADLPPDEQREEVIEAFSRVADVPALLESLLDRHLSTQKSKGADGKLPWFQAGEQVTVRGGYALAEPPEGDMPLVHPTRLPNALRFLRELA
jgi:hypothetical protein